MTFPAATIAGDQRSYWHERVRAETRAALACEDPRIAALHVELATRCLKMAGVGSEPEPSLVLIGRERPATGDCKTAQQKAGRARD